MSAFDRNPDAGFDDVMSDRWVFTGSAHLAADMVLDRFCRFALDDDALAYMDPLPSCDLAERGVR